jgi:DNA-binding GntR family transcriptional regulator
MPSLKPVSTVDALTQALRHRILDGTLAPGTYLREVQLASEYDVARHTVRAAMQALALEGVLRHTPNRGVHVPELGSDDVIDVFRLRAAIESEAVRLVITGGAPPAAAAEATELLEELPEDATWDRVVEADLAFHNGVITDAGSSRLARVFAGAQAEIELCMVQLRPNYDRPAQVAAEHRELLETIERGDLAAADQAFRKHWDDAVDNLLSSLAEGADSADGRRPAVTAPLTSATIPNQRPQHTSPTK